jgi:tyrosyl-tRNA synthetase
MSKSLGNAIGIHERPEEMYGKLMSISDELMWRYWTLLTDLRQGEIERLRSEVASGSLHPMEAKKRLARTIVAGLHSEDAARMADEHWARRFQERDLSAITEEVAVDLRQVSVTDADSLPVRVNLAKLLVALGLKSSRTEAERQITAGVSIDGVTSTAKFIEIEKRPARIAIRVGKRAKIAIFE